MVDSHESRLLNENIAAEIIAIITICYMMIHRYTLEYDRGFQFVSHFAISMIPGIECNSAIRKGRQQMRIGKSIRIADELEKSIALDPQFHLTSIRELAVIHAVSYRTMWKAIQILIARGLLISLPGNRLEFGPKTGREKPNATTSPGEKLFDEMRRRISDGRYQIGKPFPKYGYFVIDYKVSHSTVASAFLRLAHENLAHKSRRRWIVGPAPSRSLKGWGASVAKDAPVVLVFVNKQSDWANMFGDRFTSCFLVPFTQELMAHSFQLSPIGSSDDPQMPFFAAANSPREAAAIIRALGKRYQGAFSCTVNPREEQLETWLHMLVSHGKPVVYFDSADTGEYLSRQTLEKGGNYYRFYFDERAALRIAMQELCRYGHRTIGVHAWELFGWSRRRVERIEECAATLSPLPAIIRCGPAEEEWNLRESTGVNEFLKSMERRLGRSLINDEGRLTIDDKVRRLLIENASSLTASLRDKGVSALLALNDAMAREYYLWCKAIGIAIPRDLSIISFDNLPESIFFPVSTIDFGFSRLGYLAAHLIIGDISVQTDRSGAVAGTCTLIDRGSVAVPGDASELARRLRA